MNNPTTIILLNFKPEDITLCKVGEHQLVLIQQRPPSRWKIIVDMLKAVSPFVGLLLKAMSWLGKH